ncbi:MAG: c-type cytochrome [Pseudohongiellaceae bacterium]|jgi:cytochrome c
MHLFTDTRPVFRRFLVITAAWMAPVLSNADSSVDIEHGKATFQAMCGVCHAVRLTGGPVEGPNLVGVVGRQAGSHPDFGKYSEALKTSELTWSRQTLDQFLTNPMEMVPGTLMPMLIPDYATRANVIAYLASLQAAQSAE